MELEYLKIVTIHASKYMHVKDRNFYLGLDNIFLSKDAINCAIKKLL